jgi:hypothetical protein
VTASPFVPTAAQNEDETHDTPPKYEYSFPLNDVDGVQVEFAADAVLLNSRVGMSTAAAASTVMKRRTRRSERTALESAVRIVTTYFPRPIKKADFDATTSVITRGDCLG